jgi:hypothetical protein
MGTSKHMGPPGFQQWQRWRTGGIYVQRERPYHSNQPHVSNPSCQYPEPSASHLTPAGTTTDNPDVSMIQCMVDTGAALNTGNYSFYAAIVKRYPHCIAKVFLPKDYSPTIFLGVIDDDAQAITTDLSVAHLPYLNCDGNTTSITIATGLQVSVNAIIGLLFIKVTGMIIDTVDSIIKMKHLVFKPFPFEFYRATKYVPAISDDGAAIHYIKFEEVQSIIAKTDEYIATVCASNKKLPSAKRIRITEPRKPMGTTSNSGSMTTVLTNRSMTGHWHPPPSANDTTHEYHNQLLEENGYL